MKVLNSIFFYFSKKMSTQVTPMWKMRINDCLRRSNKVNLSGENIDSLEKIGTIKLMVQLDLSYVRTINSLEGFKRQPALKTFIADGSAISSLKNISSLSNVTALSIKNTPLMKSNQKFNVIASLILVMPNLRIFNGKVITQKTREKVESAGYPMPQTAKLIDAGWIVEYPCPSKKQMIELLKNYDIYDGNELGEDENDEAIEEDIEPGENDENIQNSDNDQVDENDNNDKRSPNTKQLNRSIQSQNDDNDNSDEVIRHKKSISKAQKESNKDYDESENNDEIEYTTETNENEYDDANEKDNNNNNANDDDSNYDDNPAFNKPISEMSLLEKVAMVLRKNGYEIDPFNMQQCVLNTIDSLCAEVEQMNSAVPSEQSSQT